MRKFTFSTSKLKYKELEKSLCFFVKMKRFWDSSGYYYDIWQPVDKDIEGDISDYRFKTNNVLMIVNKVVDENEEESDSVLFECYEAYRYSASHYRDWVIVLNSYLHRCHDAEDKYSYINLLWFLNYCPWTEDMFIRVLEQSFSSYILTLFEVIRDIGRCLSLRKQESLERVFRHFGHQYTIYRSDFLQEALENISPRLEDADAINLFNIVNYILVDPKEASPRRRGVVASNPLLSLYHWLNGNGADIQYDTLSFLFAIVPSVIRMQIVKRYFHDIRLGKTTFDERLLNDFKDNPCDDFIRYRYCLYTPNAPINLGVPLLCDCLSTIKKTNGEEFQTFDGVLDFAASRCDIVNPNIDLGVNSFIPRCNGGAVYNRQFSGFISFEYVYELNEGGRTRTITDTTHMLSNSSSEVAQGELSSRSTRIRHVRIYPQEVTLSDSSDISLVWCDVKQRVIDSLRRELGDHTFNGVYFEIAYDPDKLQELKRIYYYNVGQDERNVNTVFLRKKYYTQHSCSPTFSDTPHKATGLPYFWCRGTECFHNCLNEQVLTSCSDWREYTLYHLVEILGYPKLHRVEAGLEPDETIRRFLAIVNKAMKKLRHLRCRECGHLMRVAKDGSFNRYNRYCCYNPTCGEYRKEVYLNYCFNCKKGLIDSRDTTKCPNGWYICPDCHSCCDNSQYERQAQIYLQAGRPIPPSLQSRLNSGHNDKGIYFCHQCGAQLEEVDDHEEILYECQQCRVRYKINE